MANRFRTPLVIATVLSVMAGNAAHMVYRDYQETMRRRTSIVSDMAKVVEAHAFRVVDSADIALRQAANLVREAGGIAKVQDEAHWRRLREYVSHVHGGARLWLTDASGTVVMSTVTSSPP